MPWQREKDWVLLNEPAYGITRNKLQLVNDPKISQIALGSHKGILFAGSVPLPQPPALACAGEMGALGGLW